MCAFSPSEKRKKKIIAHKIHPLCGSSDITNFEHKKRIALLCFLVAFADVIRVHPSPAPNFFFPFSFSLPFLFARFLISNIETPVLRFAYTWRANEYTRRRKDERKIWNEMKWNWWYIKMVWRVLHTPSPSPSPYYARQMHTHTRVLTLSTRDVLRWRHSHYHHQKIKQTLFKFWIRWDGKMRRDVWKWNNVATDEDDKERLWTVTSMNHDFVECLSTMALRWRSDVSHYVRKSSFNYELIDLFGNNTHIHGTGYTPMRRMHS